jgi:hypothetical protein
MDIHDVEMKGAKQCRVIIAQMGLSRGSFTFQTLMLKIFFPSGESANSSSTSGQRLYLRR